LSGSYTRAMELFGIQEAEDQREGVLHVHTDGIVVDGGGHLGHEMVEGERGQARRSRRNSQDIDQ
jgi:hypothetical protein